MKRELFIWMLCLLSIMLIGNSRLTESALSNGFGNEPGEPDRQLVVSKLASMPLSFTENQGQFGERTKFRCNALGASFYFAAGEVAYLLSRETDEPMEKTLGLWANVSGMPDSPDKFCKPRYRREGFTVHARFVNANSDAKVIGERMLPHKSNYFYGNDPSKWRTNVPNYSAVRYENIYPGIDLKYYGDGRSLKYDFIVKPGADPSLIKIEYEGVNSLSVNAQGELVVSTQFGDVVERVPYVYQEIGADRREIACRYVVLDREKVGFALDKDYDRSQWLYIDPKLAYSTYLGGNDVDFGKDIAVDIQGCVYVTGYTHSPNFPTENAYDGSLGGNTDAFVTKFSASGSSPIYSTYLGGSLYDGGNGIAVDVVGCAYVAGYTNSIDFPTSNAFQDSLNGYHSDVFVTKLSVSGDSLLYSTYLGGNHNEGCGDIAVDSSGCAYVTGYTESNDFPTENPFDESLNGSMDPLDVFVTKFSESGSSLVYSTYLGGVSPEESGYDIAVDAQGCAYVTGRTQSWDFPTENPYQGTINGGTYDVFITKFSSPGSSLVYSTFLGGGGGDYGYGIAVDDENHAYVTGPTSSSNFPTENAYDDSLDGGDAFLTKLSTSGSSLVYSTYLGGHFDDASWGVAVDDEGCAYVTGKTGSYDFPTKNAYQEIFNGGLDIFVTKFSSSGDSLVYSTYLGGSLLEQGRGIAVDAQGCAYVTGYTESNDLPMVNAYQGTYGGGTKDAFVAKFAKNQPPTAFIDDIFPNPAQEGDTVTFSGHGTDADGSVVAYNWRSSIDGQLSTDSSFSTSALSVGIHTIYFKVQDDDSVWSEEDSTILKINQPPTAFIDVIFPNPADEGEEVLFIGHGTDVDGSVIGYNWRSDIDGQLSTDSSFITSNLSEGTHIICFKVQDNDSAWSEEDCETLAVRVGVDQNELSSLPKEFTLSQNYPNPFNPITKIKYALPKDGYVRLDVYNISGQRVASLVDGEEKAGYKTVSWDAKGMVSGIYFFRLQAGDFVQTRRMVLLR